MKRNEEQLYEQIDAYLNGTLSTEEQQSFEQEMQADVALSKEVAAHKELAEMMTVIELDELMNYSKELMVEANQAEDSTKGKVVQMGEREATSSSQSTSSQSKGRTRTLRSVLAIAAMLLLAVGAFLLMPSGQSSQQMAQAYWEETSPLNFPNLRGNAEVAAEQVQIKKAYDLLKDKKYQESLNVLNAMSSNASEEGLLMAGVCQYELGKIDNAIPLFKQVINNADAVQKDRAYWYLALAQLQKENNEAARKNLQVIVDKDYRSYSAKAKKLLEGLK